MVLTGKNKEWSLSEWIANFLQDNNLYDDELYAEDGLDGTIGGGGEGLEDGGLLESVVIIGVTSGLVLLLWWRQRVQQANAQADDERRRNRGQPAHQAQGDQGEGIGGFREWAAGGIGL